MVQIGNVPEIKKVKDRLDEMKKNGLIEAWSLPYENLLTRLDAAIFFLSPKHGVEMTRVWNQLQDFANLSHKENIPKSLSDLDWQVEFKAEKTVGA